MAAGTLSIENGMLALPSDQKSFEKIAPDLLKVARDIDDRITDADKERLKAYETQQDQYESQKKLENLVYATNNPRMSKMKEKLARAYDKYIVKGKFFQSALNAFKRLTEKASNWFFDLLKILLFFAIFDPKGVFLKSILGFLTKMVVWLIRLIGGYIPQLIKTIIYLVTEVIPPALKQAVNAIFDALYDVLGQWVKELPEGPLKTIMGYIREAFGPDGILRKFFVMLAGAFPIIFAGLGILAIIGKLMPVFVALKSLVMFLVANPIVAAIAGVIIFWTIMITYSKELEQLFDDIPKWLEKKFGVIGKILGAWFTYFTWVIMWPIKLALKFINFVKKNGGVSKTFDLIVNKIKSFIDFITSIPKKVIMFYVNAWKKALDWFKSIPDMIKKVLGNIYNMLPDWMKKGLSAASQKFDQYKQAYREGGITGVASQVFTDIKNAVQTIANLFKPFIDGFNIFIAWIKDTFGNIAQYGLTGQTSDAAKQARALQEALRTKEGMKIRSYLEGGDKSELAGLGEGLKNLAIVLKNQYEKDKKSGKTEGRNIIQYTANQQKEASYQFKTLLK